MSLILEALKKSEANRRLGAAPDLSTPFNPARRGRSPLPLLVAVIVALCAFGWWWLRPGTPAPTAAVRPAAAPAPARTLASNRPVPRPAPVRAPQRRMARQDRPIQPTGAAGFGPFPPGMAPPASATDASAQPRSNTAMERVRARMAARRATASAPPAAKAEPKPVSAPSATAPTRAPKTVATRGYTPPPPATPIHPASATPSAPAPSTTSASDVTPYYALAFAVRKTLPQLKLSMHVYTADPKQRFVILDDTRMLEGDTTPDGITLSQIRPDGVILEFKGQRFFFPRDGL